MALNFHGGYRLEEYKNTKNAPITNFDRAEKVFIYLENGEVPCVAVGDSVRRYDTVASNADGFITAASVSGTVVEADEKRIVISNDMNRLSADADESRPRSAYDIDIERLAEFSKKYGIRGAFSGIPVYKKFLASYGKAERIIINCIESDPSSGHVRALIKEKAKELVLGIKLIMQGMGIMKCVIAVVKNDGDSIDAIKKQFTDKSRFVFAEVAEKYPAGNEYLLFNAIYKTEYPRDTELWEKGYPLFSAETVINLFESFNTGLPTVTKVVSVSGKCVETPMNFRVPIGTPISYLFGETGVIRKGSVAYVVGGTLNGYLVNGDAPVKADTNTILALKEKNYHIGDCIKCARCTMMCPMHLTPFKFHENYELGKYDENERMGIFNCIECGVCSFVCPGKVDLLGEIRSEKALSGKSTVYASFASDSADTDETNGPEEKEVPEEPEKAEETVVSENTEEVKETEDEKDEKDEKKVTEYIFDEGEDD